MKNIVLIIDWQNQYFKQSDSRKYMDSAVKKTAKIVETARARGDHICWIAFSYHDRVLGDCGASFHPELLAVHENGDPLFIKSDCDSFTNKDFGAWIDETDFDKLIFTGFHISDCVQETYKTAVEKGYGDKVILVRDACGPEPMNGFSKNRRIKDADMFIQIVLQGGAVCSAARFIEHLQTGHPLKQIPYSPAKTPYHPSYGTLGCEFKTAVYEINDPTSVLNAYIQCRQILKAGGGPGKNLGKYTPSFMGMWARANGISQGDVDQVTWEPHDHKTAQKIRADLSP